MSSPVISVPKPCGECGGSGRRFLAGPDDPVIGPKPAQADPVWLAYDAARETCPPPPKGCDGRGVELEAELEARRVDARVFPEAR